MLNLSESADTIVRMFDVWFFINSILFGVGLAIDAFSVSVANALQEKDMKVPRMFGIAGTFAAFQTAMPMLGWICIRTITEFFDGFRKFIPWIALVLLAFLGIKMIMDALKNENEGKAAVGFWGLMLQGLATSIDALSVGLTISDYDWVMALSESLIIGVVTLGICMAGLIIGKKLSAILRDKVGIIGGVILILIGIEIFVKGIFF